MKLANPSRTRYLGRPALLALASLAALILPGLGPRVAAAAVAASSSAGSNGYGQCQDVMLPVALAPGQPANQRIWGSYCTPLSWQAGPPEVDVLTPGATYNASYWNWPVDPALYSYVDKTLSAGRATFDYDRIGTGASSHPPSTGITIDAEAYVLHQIVTWLRDSPGFTQVNLVGHSLGSVISIQEAGTYGDVSKVVVTGLLHAPDVGLGFATTLESLLYPAADDPQFAGLGMDAGYLTTIPGDRAADFYSSSADPAVVAYDEAHKDVVPLTDLATLATTWALPPGLNVSDDITVPVLVVIGQQDAIFCADPPVLDCGNPAQVLANEAPYYARAASLAVDVIGATGHDVALHPSADESFGLINGWILAHPVASSHHTTLPSGSGRQPHAVARAAMTSRPRPDSSFGSA
jgi:pimeloyl-ACP methyl ester carboxylesterase